LDLIGNFLDFLYSGKYLYTADAPGPGKVTLHVKMYSLGDKYDIPKLRDLATAELASTLDDQETPHKDLLDAIPLLYECTLEKDRKFRDVVVLSTRTRRVNILGNATLKGQLADVLKSTPEFSMDMLVSLTSDPVLFDCGFCDSKNQSLKVSQCCECDSDLYASDVY